MADTTTPAPHSQRAALLADRLADALDAAHDLPDSEWRDALAAQGQLHALLAVGEAIHAQTKMLRELLDPLGDLVDAVTVIAVRADADGPIVVTGPDLEPDPTDDNCTSECSEGHTFEPGCALVVDGDTDREVDVDAWEAARDEQVD